MKKGILSKRGKWQYDMEEGSNPSYFDLESIVPRAKPLISKIKAFQNL